MKKYVKPELIIENFELSQHIASCDYDLDENTFSDVGCAFTGVEEGSGQSISIFNDGNICNVEPEGYCYHGSTGAMYSLFNS